MILTIDNNQISRLAPTSVTLDTEALKASILSHLPATYQDLDKWKSVTLTYQSSVYSNQTKQIQFDMNPGQTIFQIQEILPDWFISEMRISSVTIYDKSNGFIKVRKANLDRVSFDIPSNALPAPLSVFTSSSNSTSGIIALEDVPKWEVGFMVRVFDPIRNEYLNPLTSILATNPATGLITLANAVSITPNTLVLRAPNSNSYTVTIDADGVLGTELSIGTRPTQKFIFNVPGHEEKYMLKVSNDGTLFVEMAILDELDLPVKDSYTMMSTGGIKWLLSMTTDFAMRTESVSTSLTGLELRFAYSDEVTLDQLKRFKFD